MHHPAHPAPSPAVTVIGSINCDLSFFVRELPQHHETVLAHKSVRGSGGKGLNQAVAAARAGAATAIIGAVGKDVFGETARRYAKQCSIDCSGLKTIGNVPTGTAAILINKAGENMIVVSPGANAQLLGADIHAHALLIQNAAIVVAQLEIPDETVAVAMSMAKTAGVRTLLNPAPVSQGAKDLLALADVVTPNETEAQGLTGILPADEPSARAAAAALCVMGAGAVVITLGAQGYYVFENGAGNLHAAFAVKAVDATGAGDVFNGVLAHQLALGNSLTKSAHVAAAAAAISVTKPGAEGAAPDMVSINNFMSTHSITR